MKDQDCSWLLRWDSLGWPKPPAHPPPEKLLQQPVSTIIKRNLKSSCKGKPKDSEWDLNCVKQMRIERRLKQFAREESTPMMPSDWGEQAPKLKSPSPKAAPKLKSPSPLRPASPMSVCPSSPTEMPRVSRSPSPTSCADSAAGPELRLWAPRFGAKGSVGELEAARKSQEQRQEAGKSDVLVVARESQQQNLEAIKSHPEAVEDAGKSQQHKQQHEKPRRRKNKHHKQADTPAAADAQPAMPQDQKEKVQHISFYFCSDSNKKHICTQQNYSRPICNLVFHHTRLVYIRSSNKIVKTLSTTWIFIKKHVFEIACLFGKRR